MQRGIIDALSPYRIAPKIYLSYEDPDKDKEIFREFPRSIQEGLIWVPSSHTNTCDFSEDFMGRIILCDRDLPIPNALTRVLLDNEFLAEQAMDYLQGKGAKKICFINGPSESYTAQERLKGFVNKRCNIILSESYTAQERLKGIKKSLKPSVELSVVYTDFIDEAVAFDIAKNQLTKNIFDGYILGNQTIAMGFIKAVKKEKIKNISLCITFDSFPMQEFLDFPISYIQLPGYRIGQIAGDLIMKKIRIKQLKHLLCKGQCIITSNQQH